MAARAGSQERVGRIALVMGLALIGILAPGPVLRAADGPVLVPGKPKESLLVERIEKGEMPPAKDEALSARQRELIRLWVSAVGRADQSRGGAAAPPSRRPG